jgi:mannose/cellobiose epimerase-like protein (N-acyl-D-glucosamine 2-epimerase family)
MRRARAGNISPTAGSYTLRRARAQSNREPGHLFEWAWSLPRFEAATGVNEEAATFRLIAVALRIGLDAAAAGLCTRLTKSFAFETRQAGVGQLRALTRSRSAAIATLQRSISAVLAHLNAVHCLDQVNGGWTDYVDAGDRPLNKTMPASTVHHLFLV